MNYLGHAYLSFGDKDVLAGNMVGDHVKGLLALEKYPEGMRKGILLHRKIDEYTDRHPATLRAKVWFRQDYGLYSGAILDTVFDHFLANDAKIFSSESNLLAFTQEVYAKLEENEPYLPEAFAGYFQHMRTHNWLYGYRNVQGINRSLTGLSRRAKYMPAPEAAYKTFIVHYYQLAQCYYELIDDVVRFVKIELSL